jgi:hypothetical protein
MFAGLPPAMTEEMWREDVSYLADTMAERHPGLFSLVSRERFDETVHDLEIRLSSLTYEQITMELFKLLALPNDAHSYPPIIYPTYDLHLFPLRLYFFDDVLYVIGTGRGYEQLTGSRLVKIGQSDISEVYDSLAPFVATENEYARKDRFCILSMLTELLHAQGVAHRLEWHHRAQQADHLSLAVGDPHGDDLNVLFADREQARLGIELICEQIIGVLASESDGLAYPDQALSIGAHDEE